MNVRNLIERNAQEYTTKSAILYRDKKVSFEALKDFVNGLAHYLVSIDRKQGIKVGVFLPTIPEYIYAYGAVYSCGKTIVPLDFMLTEDELVGVLNHSGAEYLIAFPKKGVDYAALLNKTSLKRILIVDYENNYPYSGGVESFYEQIKPFMNKEALKVSCIDDAVATVFYTSGTTGIPKGVMLTYKQLDAPPEAMKHFIDLTDHDVTLGAIPLSHSGGLVQILNLFEFGMPIVLMDRFMPLEFLKNIQQHKATIFCIVPSMYIAIVSLKEFDSLDIDLSSLRYAVVFGAPSTPELLKRFHAKCPRARLLNGWGMTETSAPNAVTPKNSEKIASVGTVVPWMECRIVDDQYRSLPAGEKGQLLVKGWPVFKGYYNNDVLNKESFTSDGFFKTGDVAYFDAEGYLYIVGRIKEIIKVGGQLVFAPEVEGHILRHPAVYETAVIGVRDTLRGEVPKAFVVAKEGMVITERELREFLKSHLAHFKMPHVIEFRLALPKNRMGKINKEELRVANSD